MTAAVFQQSGPTLGANVAVTRAVVLYLLSLTLGKCILTTPTLRPPHIITST